MALKRNWEMTKRIQRTPTNKEVNQMTFWEHLEEFRSLLLKATVLTVAFSTIAFVFKDGLFKIVLAPQTS